MPAISLSIAVRKHIREAVAAYQNRHSEYQNLVRRVNTDLTENAQLQEFIHSTKSRAKKPSHLFDKLSRKALQCKTEHKPFKITAKNIFTQINDLAGVRLLHIHTQQLADIHPKIIEILDYHDYRVVRNPVAFTWDNENEKFLKGLGLRVALRDSMYTSVHYTVAPHFSKDRCEIQVRTLAEELWGEVSHTITYPHPTDSVACKEQLLVLARVASGCTRLVDSIFASHDEFTDRTASLKAQKHRRKKSK